MRRRGGAALRHAGTEAALIAGEPLVDVDESAPLRPDSKAHYPRTRAELGYEPVHGREQGLAELRESAGTR